MASKRNLKKAIRYACGDLAAECIIARDIINNNHDEWNAIVLEIAKLQIDSLQNCSFAFDKTRKDLGSKEFNREHRAYYALALGKLRDNFNKQVEAIVKKMNALLPAEQKEINKASVLK